MISIDIPLLLNPPPPPTEPHTTAPLTSLSQSKIHVGLYHSIQNPKALKELIIKGSESIPQSTILDARRVSISFP